jgi:hypothetical protein
LKEKNTFDWTKECQVALKQCLIAAPILGHPNMEGLFTVITDASDFACAIATNEKGERDKRLRCCLC